MDEGWDLSLRPRAFVHNAHSHVGRAVCEALARDGGYDVYGGGGGGGGNPEGDLRWLKGRLPSEFPGLQQSLLASDVIVHELTDRPDAAVAALRFLAATPSERERTFILISSVLTWAETHWPPDPDDGSGSEPLKDPDRDPVTDDLYNVRVPHPKYRSWKEAEKLCKQANARDLHTYVVFAGVTYGCGEDKLHALFRRAWHGDPLPLYGGGHNVVPLVHVRDLARLILRLAHREDPEGPRYLFGCDGGNATWGDIVAAVGRAMGGPGTYVVPEAEYALHEHVDHFLLDLKVQPTGMADILGDDWVAWPGLVASVAAVVAEYRAARRLQPVRLCVLGPPAAGKTTLCTRLAAHYQLPHLTVEGVIREFEQQQAALQDRLAQIRRLQREERAKAAAAARAAAAEEEEEEEGASADPEGPEAEEEEEGEDGEEADLVKERLAEVSAVLAMKTEAPPSPSDGKPRRRPKPPGKTGGPKGGEADRPGRYPALALAAMYRWRLRHPDCCNQGFLLDGFPKTKAQARLLFGEGDLEMPGDGEPEPPQDEVSDQRADDGLLPDQVVLLRAPDAVLAERAMRLPGDAGRGPADFHRRLAAYHADGPGAEAWLERALSNAAEPREVLTLRVDVGDPTPLAAAMGPPPEGSDDDDAPDDPVLRAVIGFVGPPHNYGPTAEATEARRQRKAARERERKQVAEAACEAQEAREAQDARELEDLRREEGARLASIREQERAALELRTRPLKEYLMATVLPVLTRGLAEVCEVRPEDPVDYLAEWLFRHNPASSPPAT